MKLNNKVEESENFDNEGFYRDIKGVTFQHWYLIGWVFNSFSFSLKSERVTVSRSIVNDSLSLRDNSHPIKAFLLFLFEGWRGVESERELVFKKFQSCVFYNSGFFSSNRSLYKRREGSSADKDIWWHRIYTEMKHGTS